MTLELKNINKTYKSKSRVIKVLDNINLKVENGKFICFIGTSGCGKTTLLNVVAGFEKKTSGEIILNGKEIKSIGTDRVMMFQESALFPWLKVSDNVEFGMKMLGINKEEKKKER
ncbi:ATP-binding cassette domain-containing protein [Clostridium sp. OS1-26]|uniref:ATP-binding cassette domain-containing protein n=1 Tax=Clostridium sp. OS1-26 TaxID=3070681 RepID=UPI0027DFD5F3|nr:ATP-binding cassette domain-containing protein [Clostridium sp. OS1-26]WML36769.1 ATP-binding cassette domain-containing protein [Clostridium sp. OS1-26]